MACMGDEDGRVSLIYEICTMLSTNPSIADPFVETDGSAGGLSLEIRGDASKTQVRVSHRRRLVVGEERGVPPG